MELIKMCYSICLVKHVVLEAAQFSPVERHIWLRSKSDSTDLKGLIGFVIRFENLVKFSFNVF